MVSYIEDSKELYQKARHTFRDIAFLTIGLPVAKPKKVLSSMYVKFKKKTKWHTHNQEGFACPVPPAMGRFLDFLGKGDSQFR